MQTRAPTPREIIAESIWNSRGQPFTPIQCFEPIGVFGFNEFIPVRCQSAALIGNAAGVVDRPSSPAATRQENE